MLWFLVDLNAVPLELVMMMNLFDDQWLHNDL